MNKLQKGIYGRFYSPSEFSEQAGSGRMPSGADSSTGKPERRQILRDMDAKSMMTEDCSIDSIQIKLAGQLSLESK